MSTFGKIFKVTTFGESHGKGVGCIIDGVPSGLSINIDQIQKQLNRRKPNQNSLLSARNEKDIVEIYSGVEKGLSLGSPIMMMVKNEDMKPEDYKEFSNVPRPGHADFTYLAKYGIKSSSGGGRSSARETIARVSAGSLAEIYLEKVFNVKIVAWVNSIGDIELPKEINEKFIQFPPTRDYIDSVGCFKVYKNVIDNKDDNDSCSSFIYLNEFENLYYMMLNEDKIIILFPEENNILIKNENDNDFIIYNDTTFKYKETISIRCPDNITALKMINLIHQVKANKDSIGGCISCIISNVPIGLGEPVFDKFEAELAKAMLSIPATKGFEIGSGFLGTKMKGSEHNDLFIPTTTTSYNEDNQHFKNKLTLHNANLSHRSNFSGGTSGGITNGENVYFRVAIKPVSTIGIEQNTFNYDLEETVLQAAGRHDPCVLPRAIPIIEAMSALVTIDASLIQAVRKFN